MLLPQKQCTGHSQDWWSATGRDEKALTTGDGVGRLWVMEHIHTVVRNTTNKFPEKLHIISSSRNPGMCIRKHKHCNISLGVHVVVLNVAVKGSRLVWPERSQFSFDADGSMSDGPRLKGAP